MSEFDLTPCPFCGGSVEYQHFHISGEHHFTCGNCGALTLFSVDMSPDEAVERWNTRPIETRLRATCQAAYVALLPYQTCGLKALAFKRGDDTCACAQCR